MLNPKNKRKLINKRSATRSFNGLMHATNKVLSTQFKEESILRVNQIAQQEFEEQLLEVPYIGGRSNIYSDMLIKAAATLSLYRALLREGVSLEGFGKLLEEITKVYMNGIPRVIRKLAGKLWMSRIFIKIINKQALKSQTQVYEEDFVYEVVSACNGYKWGINYLECGIVKYFQKQGEFALAEYACMLDFYMFPAIGVDLKRTKTIAQGHDLCDFRFK
jgi:hypothetical protein